MIRRARCAVCGEKAYRNKHGKMLLHTIQIVPPEVGGTTYADICPGSDVGARP